MNCGIYLQMFCLGCGTPQITPRRVITHNLRGRVRAGERHTIGMEALSNVSNSTERVGFDRLRWGGAERGGGGILIIIHVRSRMTIDRGGGGRAYSCVACPSHSIIDDASRLGRNAVPTPKRDTANIQMLATCFPCIS